MPATPQLSEELTAAQVLVRWRFTTSISTPANILVRAIGPELQGEGVAGALQDPTLELHDGNGALVSENDNWKSYQEQTIRATTIPAADDRESAIVKRLGAGNYTAVVRGRTTLAA